ncbi:MAG: sulfoxide reductase heme-binding subunit YedZ [Azospira oryzae]|nr:MAG: sulfoxide reductase heme-binding subunit YedZ [Azospira oryzae]PZP68820.1 MAG: sulfoxide reductase heme-binding subunit YedZ [Delftia acidovorans]PZP83091.1 MAG: sulfoxide reductase heme-binding subunit YedZ [Azospira oryzae]
MTVLTRLAQLPAVHAERLKRILFVLCLLPLARWIWLGFNDGLGANPVEFIIRSTGFWALAFLAITLAVTPLRRWLQWPWLLRLRRMLGLYAFFYACLHFAAYLVLDQFFDLAAIVEDVVKRPYITVGFTSFVLLVPLAITSTDGMIRRLGGRRWRRLHRLVYAIGVGGVIHFWWLVKADITQPFLYAIALGVLLGERVVHHLRIRVLPSPGTGGSARAAIPLPRD